MPERIGWLELIVAGVAAAVIIGGIAWITSAIINYKLWHRPKNRRKKK